jgi:hypothetical protein
MSKLNATFLRFAPAFAVLLTCALAPITAEATVIAPFPSATNGTVDDHFLEATYTALAGSASLDVSGSWSVTGNGPSPVTTSYVFSYPGSVALTAPQSYQITNALQMIISGSATSGSYSATTYLDSLPGMHLAGAFATASGNFTTSGWSNGSLLITPLPATTNYLLSGASGPYYLEQDVTVSFNGVSSGQMYTIDLPSLSTDDSRIAPAPAPAIPEPASLAVWAGLGIVGVICAWRVRRRA